MAHHQEHMECDMEWRRFLNSDDVSAIVEDDAITDDDNGDDDHSFETTVESDLHPEELISNINISTTTKITYMNKGIDLKDNFWRINVMHYYTPEEGVIKKQIKYIIEDDDEQALFDRKIKEQSNYVELMDLRKKNIIGTNKKTGSNVYKLSIGIRMKDIVNQKMKKTQAFFNCFVLVLRLKSVDDDGKFVEVHMKIFNTGKIEVPGMKNNAMFQRVLELFRRVYEKDIGHDIKFRNEEIETILINSNFNCGFFINREKFYHILKRKYNLNCSYDPCTYPGIQNMFYFDRKNPDVNFNGILNSKLEVTDKKKRKSSKNYVSFMVFRTGSILIVGKCDETILMKIYDFIKKVLIDEYDDISDGLNGYQNGLSKKKKTYRCIKYNGSKNTPSMDTHEV